MLLVKGFQLSYTPKHATMADFIYACVPKITSPFPLNTNNLVEWVGSGTPVGQEQAEADSLEETGDETDGNSVKRSLLSDNTGDELRNMSELFHCFKFLVDLHLEQQRQRRSENQDRRHL